MIQLVERTVYQQTSVFHLETVSRKKRSTGDEGMCDLPNPHPQVKKLNQIAFRWPSRVSF